MNVLFLDSFSHFCADNYADCNISSELIAIWAENHLQKNIRSVCRCRLFDKSKLDSFQTVFAPFFWALWKFDENSRFSLSSSIFVECSKSQNANRFVLKFSTWYQIVFKLKRIVYYIDIFDKECSLNTVYHSPFPELKRMERK